MKLFAVSDIHGALKPIHSAGPLIREADRVVIAGDLTRSKTRAEAEDVIACIEQYSENILAVHGNWDRIEVADFLVEKGYSLHGDGRILEGTGFFGVGGSSPTPFHTATEYSEDEISGILQAGYRKVREAPVQVLVTHAPPFGVLDMSYFGQRGGSHGIRSFLEANAVALCLCGHIHEAAGIEWFGKTLVANSGTFQEGHYVSIDLKADLKAVRGRVKA